MNRGEIHVDFLNAMDGSLVDSHIADDVEPAAYAVTKHLKRQDAFILEAAAQRRFGTGWVGDVLDAIQTQSYK